MLSRRLRLTHGADSGSGSTPAANGNGWNNTECSSPGTEATTPVGPESTRQPVPRRRHLGEGELTLNATCKDLPGTRAARRTPSRSTRPLQPRAPLRHPLPIERMEQHRHDGELLGNDGLSGIEWWMPTSCSAAKEPRSLLVARAPKAGDESAPATASGIKSTRPRQRSRLSVAPHRPARIIRLRSRGTTCNASDTLSGLDGVCVVSGYSNAVGTHTVTRGTDREAIATFVLVQVLAWTLRGFYQPVDMGGVFNAVKGGATVPLEFEALAGPTELTDVSSIKSLRAGEALAMPPHPSTTRGDATGATTLRYDTTSASSSTTGRHPSNQASATSSR